MRSFLDTPFICERLIQSGQKSVYVKSSDGIGHLKQMDERAEKLNELQIGTGYRLLTDGSSDIVTTDRIIVDNTYYEVSGVRVSNFGSVHYKEITLVKQ